MAKPDYLKMFAEIEKQYGHAPGTLAALKQQEVGNDPKFEADPTAFHYGGPNPKSSARGLFGVVKGTAADPGYGVKPLTDWSPESQAHFAASYLQALQKKTGSLKGGLAAYGEGPKYAQQVASRIKGGPVQLAQVPEVQAVAPTQVMAKELPSLTPNPVPIAQAPVDMEWRQLQQAMPAKPVQVADLEYGDQMPMAQPYQFAKAQPVQVMQPNFSRFNSWIGKA